MATDFRDVSLDECVGLVGEVPDRADRLPQFVGLRVPAAERLDSLRVAIIGTGSVGGVIASHCARLQLREIQLVDPSAFKPASLITHAVPPSAVGQKKADYWGRMAKANCPRTRVRVFDGRVQSLPIDAFADVDVVVMATDNLAAEVDVAQRCLWLDKELHQAAVHGETILTRNMIWLNRGAAGPCPACNFSEVEWLLAGRDTRFVCSGPDGEPIQEAGEVVPTMSLSFLCGMSAEFTMVNIVRSALALGQPLTDSVQEFCGYTARTTVSPLKRNPNCPLDHTAWAVTSAERPLANCSLRELADLAELGGSSEPPDLSFVVDDLQFVESSLCCGAQRPIGRFACDGQPAGRCNACGQPMPIHEYFSHRPVPASALNGSMCRPLGELGAESARGVVVRGGGRAVLVREQALN
jgi:molybdopterin/thiamine biosynthesis adenylyltransferase